MDFWVYIWNDWEPVIIWIVYNTQGILKREPGLFFDPCVNAMRRWPYWPSRTEVSYWTFRFCGICSHYRYRVIHRAITYMCAWFKSTWERQLTLNCMAGLTTKKSRGTITHLHMWRPPQQIPPLNFLGNTWAWKNCLWSCQVHNSVLATWAGNRGWCVFKFWFW